jgi:hypothetical protein
MESSNLLPSNLNSSQIRALSALIYEKRSGLEASAAFREFEARLKKRFILNTARLDNLMALSESDVQMIMKDLWHNLPSALHQLYEKLFLLFDFAEEAVIKRAQLLNIDFLKKIYYRLHDEPPVFSDRQLQELRAFFDRYTLLLMEGNRPEALAAWFIAGFIRLNLFAYYNNFIAILLASLIFMREGWFPLIIEEENEKAYFDAVAASSAELYDLAHFLAGAELAVYHEFDSSDFAYFHPEENLDKTLENILGKLDKNRQSSAFNKSRLEVFHLASFLSDEAFIIFRQTAEKINAAQIKSYTVEAYIKSKTTHFANVSYNDTISLVINVDGRIFTHFDLTFFENASSVAAGLLQAEVIAYFFSSHAPLNNNLSEEPFNFAYNEDPHTVLTRFRPWLTKALALGAVQWVKLLEEGPPVKASEKNRPE